MAEIRKPKFFYGYVVVVAGFFTLLVMYGTAHTFGVFFKPLLTEFGWTRAATAGAFSLYAILHGALFVVTGRLNDRFGPRLVVTGCGFLLGLGYLLMSQISAIWQLYLFYGVIVAVGMSGSAVPVTSTVARWFVKRRGLMTGIVIAAAGVGAVIMPPLASRLIIAYRWPMSYIIVGFIALVFTTLAAQFLRRDPAQVGRLPYGADEAKPESLVSEGISLRQAVRSRQFWQLCAILACSWFSVTTITVHIVAHATDLGMSVTSAANVLAVIGGLSIVGRIAMGAAADRISGKASLIIVCILMSVALFFLVGAKEAWMLYLFGIVFGFAWGGLASLQSLMVAELFGLSSLGTIMGSVAFITNIGNAAGPVVAGSIFDITGSYSLAFLVSAVLSVIGLILTILFRPTGSEGGQK